MTNKQATEEKQAAMDLTECIRTKLMSYVKID
jgi:hypothetical protein